MSKVSSLPALTSSGLDGSADYTYIVDVSDTSTSATGASKKAKISDLVDSYVPTAEELSGGTNLQDYIDEQLAKDHMAGPILLPRGTITIDQTLLLDSESPSNNRGIHGVTIQGTGARYRTGTGSGTWPDPRTNKGTMIRLSSGNESLPVIRCVGQYIRLQDFSVQHQAGTVSNKVGTGISFINDYGFGSTYNTLDGIVFNNLDVGCVCGDAGSSTTPGADISFRSCQFLECNIGFQTKEIQSVAFSFTDMCYWVSCTTCIDLEAGGNVYVFGCATNGIDTFMKIVGGSATMPCLIHGVRFDRTGGAGIPTVVDGTAGTFGSVRVAVEALQFTALGSDPWTTSPIFKLKDNYSASGSKIKIGLTNRTELDDPQIFIYNDSDTLVGYLDQNDNYVPAV